MSQSINRVELLGRVGKAPEMRYTPDGTPVTQVNLATDRYRRDKENGTDWHYVTVFGHSAEAVNDYVKTGQRLFVEGRLAQESFEDKKTSSVRYVTKIYANNVVFLDGPRGGRRVTEGGETLEAEELEDGETLEAEELEAQVG